MTRFARVSIVVLALLFLHLGWVASADAALGKDLPGSNSSLVLVDGDDIADDTDPFAPRLLVVAGLQIPVSPSSWRRLTAAVAGSRSGLEAGRDFEARGPPRRA